jgi:transcriptional regulator with XRE-family HTH domain
MKNINKPKLTLDPMAVARKNPKFLAYAREAAARIKLGAEIYSTRMAQNISQQELARITKTTQKMISNIENGGVDVRFSTLNKIKEALNFQAENWSKIYGFSTPIEFYWVGGGFDKENNKNINKTTSFVASNEIALN